MIPRGRLTGYGARCYAASFFQNFEDLLCESDLIEVQGRILADETIDNGTPQTSILHRATNVEPQKDSV